MGGRRGGEQSSSRAAWSGAWGPANSALEAKGFLVRRVEAAREPNLGVTELAGREETGAASDGASGRER
jgi:hypothetical protein